MFGRPQLQKKKEPETVGELSKVCSHMVLYLARIGRLDILWSVNKLARAVTKRTNTAQHCGSV